MRSIRRMYAVALALAVVGCGEDEITEPTAGLDRVVVGSATMSLQAGQRQGITATGVNGSNVTLTGVTFTYSSGSQNVAVVASDGTVTGLAAGSSTITVTGTHQGVSKTATVTVTVTGTLSNAVTVVAAAAANTFTPDFVVLPRGGTVSWTFTGRNHNVTFAATAGAPANIPTTANSTTPVPRTFSAPGTFAYTCTLHAGMAGTVMVP